MKDDCWLSGFADGEASFAILRISYDNKVYYRPEFIINLRSDDADILIRLWYAFGGGLYHEPPRTFNDPKSNKEYTSKPRSKWNVLSKKDLAGIVEYFEKFPLRSKKARDFEIWKKTVDIYIRYGRSDLRLPGLQEDIREGRKYEAIMGVLGGESAED